MDESRVSQRPTVRQMAEAGVLSLDALGSVTAAVAKRDLEAARLRLRCRATEPPTYQARLATERESHRQQVEAAMPRNHISIVVANGVAGAVCCDKSERRATYVQLDAPALQQLIRDAQDALHQLTETSAPETLRGADDVLRV